MLGDDGVLACLRDWKKEVVLQGFHTQKTQFSSIKGTEHWYPRGRTLNSENLLLGALPEESTGK